MTAAVYTALAVGLVLGMMLGAGGLAALLLFGSGPKG